MEKRETGYRTVGWLVGILGIGVRAETREDTVPAYIRIEDFSADHNITIKPLPRLCISIIFPAAVVQLTSAAAVASSLIVHAAKHCINSQ